MTKDIIWTKAVLEAFIEEGNLNKRQEYIVRTRAQGYTIPKQAEELHLSVDQVNKDIAEIKKIYDAAQINSNILPPWIKRKRWKIKLLHYIFIIILLLFYERIITESLQVFYSILCYVNIVVKIRRKEGGIKNDK